jgi:hypothetical protein
MAVTMGNTTITGITSVPSGSITATNMGMGTVLQVVQTVKSDTWSGGGAGTTWYTVTGFTANITPQFSTSKVLVKINVVLGTQYWEIQGNLLRDAANIAASQGTARGSRPPCSFSTNMADASGATGYNILPTCFTYLDSPATTSETSYGISLNGFSTYPIYVNRSYNDNNAADYYGCPTSTITLMEIKA